MSDHPRPPERQPPLPPLRAHDLDALTRGTCQCCDIPMSAHNPLSFTGACHPHAPTKTEYWDSVVTVRCAVCMRLIVRIAVDPRLIVP